jgi:hypothetical protein
MRVQGDKILQLLSGKFGSLPKEADKDFEMMYGDAAITASDVDELEPAPALVQAVAAADSKEEAGANAAAPVAATRAAGAAEAGAKVARVMGEARPAGGAGIMDNLGIWSHVLLWLGIVVCYAACVLAFQAVSPYFRRHRVDERST